MVMELSLMMIHSDGGHERNQGRGVYVFGPTIRKWKEIGSNAIIREGFVKRLDHSRA